LRPLQSENPAPQHIERHLGGELPDAVPVAEKLPMGYAAAVYVG
jgi:hypothetical protein